MQLKITFSFLFFLFYFVSPCSAQSSASVNSQVLAGQINKQLTIGGEDWTFYLDKESNVYYIDFESISVNLSDIKVYDKQGEVVLSDKLWDLPVNTIYELDLNKLQPGDYKIELRSYTGVIQKDVSVSE